MVFPIKVAGSANKMATKGANCISSKDRTLPTFGKIVSLQRTNKGLSLAKLAKQTGLTISSITLIEHGVSQPSGWAVREISIALGLDPAFLLGCKLAENLSDEELGIAMKIEEIYGVQYPVKAK